MSVARGFAAAEKNARETMNYHLRTCGVWHQYERGKIDWKENPTYNAYKEYVWQLGRFNFLKDLGDYYAASKDPEAARTFVEMISSWIDQADYNNDNPFPRKDGHDGVCWRSLDAGIRVKNWAIAWEKFRDAPEITPEFKAKLYASLRQHGEHLVNFSTDCNWLLYEMTGLVYLSVLFPDLEKAAEWKTYALDRLGKELNRQLFPDGFQYELTTGYHGSLAINYLRILDLLAAHNEKMPSFASDGLERAYELYVKVMRPDGKYPGLNDASPEACSGYLESALRYYPERPDFLFIASKGKKGAKPPYNSIALDYAGAFFVRTGWGEKDVWAYMDCGPFGRAHQHEDKLNFLLFAYGKEMVRDGCNYEYDRSEMRQYVLSTRAHNTVMIDHKEQNRRAGFKWHDEDISKKADFTYSVGGDVEWAKAKYVGKYGNKKEGEIEGAHKRSLYFVKNLDDFKPFFIIDDVIGCKDDIKHDYEVIYHLEETQGFVQGARDFAADFGDGVKLYGFCSTDAFKDQIGIKTPKLQGWKPVRKPGMEHEHTPIHTPSVVGKFSGSKRVVSVMYPTDDGDCPIAAVEAGEGIADRDITIILKNDKRIKIQ